MKKIAFVTSWYGESIPGGAETELRGIVKHLYAAGLNVEILTTCIKEFASDWNKNYYKPGLSEEGGIIVRRFLVKKRDTASFDRVNYKLINGLHITSNEEQIFMREMANSTDLYDYIKEKQEEYDLFVYIPYMFGTTYYGIQSCPEKSVLISCFHDESYIHMNIYKEVFSKLKGIIFLSKAEQELANRVFDLSNVKQKLLGAGVDTNYVGNRESFLQKYHINFPFILYAGRKDEGKNIYTLINYFTEYKKRNKTEMKLLLIGGGNVVIPKTMKKDIIDMGFLSVQDKFDAYSAAEILCQPSYNESFSIVIMESWLMSRPVLVHGKCEVTKNFVKESNGGLFFENYYEFEGCIDYFCNNKDVAEQMGKNGKKYVMDNFTWDVIVNKLIHFFDACIREGI